MAMGSKGRRAAENAIASCRPFKNSTGSLTGTQGSTHTLGWLESHADARRIRELLSRAVYVVWSYGTPIAWVTEAEDGDRQAYYVDESHSMTTSHHQTLVRQGFREYETIGDRRRPARRPRRIPVQVPAVPERFVTNHRGVRYDSRVERDTAFDRDMAEARTSVPADSPGYSLGRTESEQEVTLQNLLDPRYRDPNWVPGRDPEADHAAEMRDQLRVEREGTWRP